MRNYKWSPKTSIKIIKKKAKVIKNLKTEF